MSALRTLYLSLSSPDERRALEGAAARLGAEFAARGARAVLRCVDEQKVYLAARVVPRSHHVDHDSFTRACEAWL